MSRKRLITFQPTSGVFKKAIKPYLDWYERSDMSPALEIEGADYRFLTSIEYWRNISARKVLVCKENGQVEKSEHITRQWCRVYSYLGRYITFKQNMEFDARQGKKSQHEPLIEAFQTMAEELKPALTDQENGAMDFHLHYLREVYRLSQMIAQEVEQLMNCKNELESLPGDKLPSSLIDKVITHFQTWSKLRYELEAILLEDGQRARDTVRSVLQNSSKTKHLRSKKHIHKIMEEIDGAENAAKRALEQERRHAEVASIEDYIHELRYERTQEQFIQEHVDRAIKKDWALSPDCVWMK